MVKNLHWQHCIMYMFLAVMGVIKILCFIVSSLPVSLVKLMTSNAFFVEGKYVGGGFVCPPFLPVLVSNCKHMGNNNSCIINTFVFLVQYWLTGQSISALLRYLGMLYRVPMAFLLYWLILQYWEDTTI